MSQILCWWQKSSPKPNCCLSLQHCWKYQDIIIIASFDLGKARLGPSGCRGICAYIKNSIGATEIRFHNSDILEQLWIQTRLEGADNLIIGIIYRSPSVQGHQSIASLGEIFKQYATAIPRTYCSLVILTFLRSTGTTHFHPQPTPTTRTLLLTLSTVATFTSTSFSLPGTESVQSHIYWTWYLLMSREW